MRCLTCSVKIFPSDVYACLREVEKIKGRGIEISAMELNSVKLCKRWRKRWCKRFFISPCSRTNRPDLTHSYSGRLHIMHPSCKPADDALPGCSGFTGRVFGSYPGVVRPYENSKSCTSLRVVKPYAPLCVP